jgi:hypothetical protein
MYTGSRSSCGTKRTGNVYSILDAAEPFLIKSVYKSLDQKSEKGPGMYTGTWTGDQKQKKSIQGPGSPDRF